MQVIDEELPKHLHSWLKSLLDILSTITLISFIMPLFSLAVCPLIILFLRIQVRQFSQNILTWRFIHTPFKIKKYLQMVIIQVLAFIFLLSVMLFFSPQLYQTHGGKPSCFSGVCDTVCWSSTFWAKIYSVSDTLPPSLKSKPAGQVQQNQHRKVKKGFYIHFVYAHSLRRILRGPLVVN